MDIRELNSYYHKFKYGEDIFHALMQHRVREILMVSSFYDAYIFEQDGRLAEQIFGEFHSLNLTFPSRITSVPTGEEALHALEKQDFDLVITMMRIGELSPFELAQRIKQKTPALPVLLLLNRQADMSRIDGMREKFRYIDNIFLWNGDSQIFLAMIKSIEDRMNVAYDTAAGLVRVILLVEDSTYFYSRYLPILYHAVMLQTQLLISQELNEIQKNYRMRTRPKVLLAHTYEDAMSVCEQFKDSLLCIISDVRFPRGDRLDSQAGVTLIQTLREQRYDVPMLLQSSETCEASIAHTLGAHFLHKHSATLLKDLSEFIRDNLGFGDFVFRLPDGREIARVSSITEFESTLRSLPEPSLIFHSERDHFSAWLIAHGEIQVARAIKPLHLEDFGGHIEEIRQFLVDTFHQVRSGQTRGNIIDFEANTPGGEYEIVRLSEGSLGGKGRGIAFLNALFTTMDFEHHFQGARIVIPKTAFIGTGEFDRFLEQNHLRHRFASQSDDSIRQAFREGALSPELREKLSQYLTHLTRPLAVRSSGLLEDSQSQAFAGVYHTVMLPNNHPDKAVRQQQLEEAIKLVYASTFLQEARDYIECIRYRIEEEKMAVIIQELVGERHGEYYYPHISGVAQSYNFYPTGSMHHHDGIAALALGLGQWVVEGEQSYRFCPAYPKVRPMPPEDLFRNSQTAFFALNLANSASLRQGGPRTLERLDLRVAEQHGTLRYLASTWDIADQCLRSGLSSRGPRVITFANILQQTRFPLADILREILDIGEKALGVPVEIEFAANIPQPLTPQHTPTLYLLQIRPLLAHAEEMLPNGDATPKEELLLYTEHGMGNGALSDIHDLVYVLPETFDNTKTVEIQQELQGINERLSAEQRPYILIGPGRWGSRDRFLGIPVRWADISQARIIVETGLENFRVDASQGTHFFHNLVSVNAGYFTVPYASEKDLIDWRWLRQCSPVETTRYLVHLRSEHPFIVKMFGKKGTATISKPKQPDPTL